MITCSSSNVAGYQVTKTLGLATGSTIRARHIGKDILAVFKNIVGGEIEEYSKMLGEAREQALDRMCARAQELGANAVIDVRFASSYVMGSASEILAYGTAVTVEPETN
jgi:uncharacterized protein YbjQ (UPF0145 family)